MPLMQSILPMTLSTAFRKARSVNQTSNGYVSKVPAIAEPTGDAGTATGASVIDLCDRPTGFAQNIVLICPYAIGSNNNTFSVRVIGWRFGGDGNSDTTLWIPVTLGDFACTISSSAPGVAARFVLNTELFADTITLTGTTTNAGTAVDIVSPANDTIGHFSVDMVGFQKLELSFTTGGSATSCNALLALL